MVTQDYSVYIAHAHVIVGNDALLKCDIPSFVGDLVTVTSWIDNQGTVFTRARQGKNGSLRPVV